MNAGEHFVLTLLYAGWGTHLSGALMKLLQRNTVVMTWRTTRCKPCRDVLLT